MRTTLAIDDDVLAAAKHLAAQQQKTVGQVLSDLARQGLTQAATKTQARRNGLLLLPKRQTSKHVTMAHVNQLRGEMPSQRIYST